MRGAVLHYDKDQDYGYINGVDGKRYFFTRNDLNQGAAFVSGTLVEFQPDDGTAHNIVAVNSTTTSSPRRQPTRSTGLWAYFRYTVSVDFFNFKGRARRKEFWAFWLCSTIVLFVLLGLGILVDLAINGFRDVSSRNAIGFLPFFVFALALNLPWIALAVRRLHDVGLSGWFVLLCFIPVIGGVALLVLGLAPSQLGENPWGPVPAGVRI
ncbi:DUF805 domain-containing protein [Mesorhizobium sp. M7A.F.Ca.US.006.01.1.1]|uniref:DUF805 domain-containing protein n=1 Tax=Mesorhizobium sp. M7A.F.Ca.US.006.01.1.1 TaxID=2496707 RepID=UPI000FCCA6B8|nr:DUF805 domain-containing protein [Mesorhizobium sp. M7A.F.Ca.US.006.01.1.1]RUZ78902.1 DUF805 domain-containing protein [Mesorhizobium sp. M7A.F.Ca.US.006.01.1.1]